MNISSVGANAGKNWLVPNANGGAAPSATPAILAAASPNAEEVSRTDSEFARLFEEETPEDTIRKQTEDGMRGMWKWQVEQMKKKIAAQLMGQMNLTRESVEALPDDQRVELERKIMAEVERRLQLMISEEMKKRQKDGEIPLELQGAAPVVDVTA